MFISKNTTNRWRAEALIHWLIVAIVCANCGLLAATIALLLRLLGRINHRHRKDSFAMTTRGLWIALSRGLEQGEVPEQVRQAIYRAADEQWDLYLDEGL